MPRESLQQKKTRALQIIDKLKLAYPEVRCELNFSSPVQLLIATILSAQSTDRQVNVVTSKLFQRYKTAEDLADADLGELESHIKTLGLYRNKAKNIQATCRILVEKFGGRVPQTMEELLQLEGVGRKTANVVLSNAFGINEGVVVDTHVGRLSRRLGLSSKATPEKIEQDLQVLAPRSEWMLFSHLLIWHGRRRCYARTPDCPNCEVRMLCPTGQKVLSLPEDRGLKMRRQL